MQNTTFPKPYRVTVYYNKEAHVSRLITGFHLLEQSGVLNVSFCENLDNFRRTPHRQIVEVEVCGKLLAFDMCDAFGLDNPNGRAYLNRVDAYFKRSYDPEMEQGMEANERDKIRPFGFDYYATYRGNPIDDKPVSLKNRLFAAIRMISGYDRCMFIDAFEAPANRGKNAPKIIFMTRLWDPDEIKLDGVQDPELLEYRKYMIWERKKINHDRIEIVRTLRKKYGKNFIGGIQDSAFAEKECPDLIIPKALTRKKTYLTAMKRADICIGSMGLHRSTGWKTGEYVAASRAIVAERLCYDVPGDFQEGRNYLPFDTVEECLSHIDRLCNDPEAIFAMKRANEEYYRDYLRPERQILNALTQYVSI